MRNKSGRMHLTYPFALALGFTLLAAAGPARSQSVTTESPASESEARPGVVGIIRFTFAQMKSDQQIYDFQNTFVSLLGAGLGMQGVPTVERNEQILVEIDKEVGKPIAGYVDRDTAAKAGKKLGARWVLTGVVQKCDLSKDRGHIEIRAKLVNVETGAPIELNLAVGDTKSKSSESFLKKVAKKVEKIYFPGVENLRKQFGRTESPEFRKTPLYEAIMRAAFQLGDEICTTVPPIRGRVTAVPGKDEALIDLGTTSGIKPGAKFIVFKRDPIKRADGTIADYRNVELATAEAVMGQVNERSSILKIVGALPGGSTEIQEGYFARRRPLTANELEERLQAEKKAAEGRR